MLGPTKIYLAVQPAPSSQQQQQQSQQQQQQQQQPQQSQGSATPSTPTTPASKPAVVPASPAPAALPNSQAETAAAAAEASQSATPATPEKPKVVVQQVSRASVSEDEAAPKTAVANGQQPAKTSKEGSQPAANKFILTPDYIQQSNYIPLPYGH